MGNRNTQDGCLQPAPFEGAIQVANRVIIYRLCPVAFEGATVRGWWCEIISPPYQRRCVPDLGRTRSFGIGAGRGIMMKSEGAVLEWVSPSFAHTRGRENDRGIAFQTGISSFWGTV